MALTPLRTRISLDQIRCFADGDGFGSAEPYLWTVFFKIDGDTCFIGDDLFLHGECTIAASDGNHGNLGDTDVDSGDLLNVPFNIGEFRTTLRPIPLSEKLQQDHPDEGPRSGQIGVVMVLLEEDQVTDAGARAGYAVLVDFIRTEINRLISTLNIGNQDVSDDQINELIDKAFVTVEDAIRNVQDGSENFWSWVDADDTIGFKVLRFKHEDLIHNYWDISERFQHVASNGVITDDWLVLGEAQGTPESPYGYTHHRRTQDVGAPAATGVPATCVHPSGVENIVYGAVDGHLHELWRDGIGQIGTGDVTAAGSAPNAGGDPFAYLETSSGLEVVPYCDPGGGVHSLYWSTGAVGHDALSATAGSPGGVGRPVATFNPASGTTHVVYRSGDGHLHVVYWTGASDPAHYEGPLTEMVDPQPPRALGDPSVYFNSAGDNIVVYRAVDQQIHALYWSTGPVGHDALSGVAGSPPAAGDPIAYYIPGADLNQVTYRATDGHLYELYWQGVNVVAPWDLTTASGAPEAVSDPAAYYSAATNTKHVFYVGPFRHVYEIWWPLGGAPSVVDLTVSGLAPRAADRPAAFTVDAAGTRHAVYRGLDDQIHEIRWAANPGEPAGRQGDWRWCNKCQGLYYGFGVATSHCPSGGTHAPAEQTGSFDYQLPHGAIAGANEQPDWRWCSKCQGLYYGPGVAASHCPTSGTHASAAESGSWNYHLPHDAPVNSPEQPDWRWCNKCQGLYYGPGVAASHCPTGGTHTPAAESGSWDYHLPYYFGPF